MFVTHLVITKLLTLAYKRYCMVDIVSKIKLLKCDGAREHNIKGYFTISYLECQLVAKH